MLVMSKKTENDEHLQGLKRVYLEGLTDGYLQANSAFVKMFKTNDSEKTFTYVTDLIEHLDGDVNIVKIKGEDGTPYFFMESVDIDSEELKALTEEAKEKALENWDKK